MTDHDFINRCIELAKKANGKTWPNPMVGAVIVKNGKIIGEGFYEKAGSPHAEVMAIQNATEPVEGSTIYVNLEPCCHTNKRTPPCAQRLIQEKFKRVVISNLDPNPEVSGKGVELLRAHHIEVDVGIQRELGEELNEVFFHAQRNKNPFVHLKLASSLDGKIALDNGKSQWITTEASRAYVHYLRSLNQAIAIGANTLRIDNPKLNVRLPNQEPIHPIRIIFTESGNIPKDSQLFTDEKRHQTLIYTKKELSMDFPKDQIILIKDLKDAMDDLFHRKIYSLFLEGGAKLASSFIKENLVQRVSNFINPSLIGSQNSSLSDLKLTELEKRPRLTKIQTQWFDEDIYITGIIKKD